MAGLSLNACFGSSDVEFDEFSDLDGDYSGNKKSFAPEYTFNIGAKYRTSGGFYGGTKFTGYGKMYTDKENLNKCDEYHLVNAKAGYESEYYDIYLYGKNIFDTEYESVYDGMYTNYSEPVEAGVAISYRF